MEAKYKMENTYWEPQTGTNRWQAQAIGETIQGSITSIDVHEKWGKQYSIMQADGEEIKLPSHKVLQGLLSKAKIGDIVKIRYEGEEPPKTRGENPTKLYKVWIQRTGTVQPQPVR